MYFKAALFNQSILLVDIIAHRGPVFAVAFQVQMA
jgi:hypothetical protein